MSQERSEGSQPIFPFFPILSPQEGSISSRLPYIMSIAAGIGALSGITDRYLSFYLNIASGAAVLVTTFIFAVIFLFAPRCRFVWRVV